MREFLQNVPRHLFFTGKGGVGKTSLACASAVALADGGKHVLLVSTDPASNLDEVLATRLGPTARPVAGVPRLDALNIDPLEAARAYRERLIEPYRAALPAALVRNMEEQLSGACTTEIAAFDEFCTLLGNPDRTSGYDHIVFDTAPTGHTLRLLTLPRAWTEFMDTNTSGTSCLGPLAGLKAQEVMYRTALAELRDGNRTVMVLVTRSQTATLREAQRTSEELADEGVTNQRVIVNGVFHASDENDTVAAAYEQRGVAAREAYHEFLSRWPATQVTLQAHNLLGVESLRSLVGRAKPPTEPSGIVSGSAGTPRPTLTLPATLDSLVDALSSSGHGVVMTMGKGGVGKTTIAAAIASELARRGHRVTLSTTDPAAHVDHTIGIREGLHVTTIDPERETALYRQEVLGSAGKDLDTDGRALLEEDLRSPCTEEIAIFRAFARTVAEGASGFVVLDTAPTGHTLLLLDATEAYHREVSRLGSELPEAVRELLPRLRAPDFTRVIITTLPEATPVHEAAQLQDDLRRAGIEPFAWVINQSLLRSETSDALLVSRGQREIPYIREVAETLSIRVVLLPWLAHEPVGEEGLAQFFAAQPMTETKP